MSLILNSSLVVWRESFEAMLVIYLVWIKLKSHPQSSSLKKILWLAVSTGVFISLALGLIAMYSQDLFDSKTLSYLQGFLPVIASLLMMHMILWMGQHATDLKNQIQQIDTQTRTLALSVFALLFITIVREGFETVVFLSGIAMALEGTQLVISTLGSGLLIGLILSLLTVSILIFGKKLMNLSLFFAVTNFVLLYIAADLFSSGISQLIDLDMLPVFNVHWAMWLFILVGCILMRQQLIMAIRTVLKYPSLKKICLLGILLAGVQARSELNLNGYGVFDYRRFQTFKTTNNYEPFFREQFDLSEFAIEAEYLLDNGSELEFEIEIEHGGTGTAYEFEPLEEFGEFETEVEKGGEVVLSEFSYFKRLNRATGIRIGKFPLTIGLGSIMTNPTNNISITASRLEANMIPVGWNEVGVQLEHKWNDLRIRLALVNGLNSEFFRTYNWIGGGYQRHFESINTEGKAVATTLEYGNVQYAQGFAVSYYQGDSGKNRYKTDKLSQSAEVRLYSALGNYRLGSWTLMGQYVRGYLENSAAVIDANSTLGGLAKPKGFAVLGSEAVLRTFQVSYDVIESLSVYAKTEFVNTFFDVDESVSDLPRYQVSYNALGARWIIDENSQLKFEGGVEKTRLDGLPETKHYAMSFVMNFSGTN